MAVQEIAAQLSMALKVQEYPTLKVCQAFLLHTLNVQSNRSRLRYITVITDRLKETIDPMESMWLHLDSYLVSSRG